MERKDLLYLGAFALLLFLFGSWLMPVTDPVESNYVETAKEMIAAGDYLSPRIFGNYWYDKPILFYWEIIAAFSFSACRTSRRAFSRHCSRWRAYS